jgi:transcriptional antiterminator NusG
MQKGIEIFLPRIIVPSRRRDRKLLINLPLFPGYLFVHADLVTSVYHKIIKQPGVVRLLWRNGNPSPVSNEKIESIKIIVESDRPYYPWGYLDSGKRVRIIDGPLSGAVGIIERRRDKKRRLVVAVELFQRSVAVELDEETVERWSWKKAKSWLVFFTPCRSAIEKQTQFTIIMPKIPVWGWPMKTGYDFIKRMQEDAEFREKVNAFPNSKERLAFLKSEGYDFMPFVQILDNLSSSQWPTSRLRWPRVSYITGKARSGFLGRINQIFRTL